MKYEDPKVWVILLEKKNIVTVSPGTTLDGNTPVGGGTEDDDSLGFGSM